MFTSEDMENMLLVINTRLYIIIYHIQLDIYYGSYNIKPENPYQVT